MFWLVVGCLATNQQTSKQLQEEKDEKIEMLILRVRILEFRLDQALIGRSPAVHPQQKEEKSYQRSRSENRTAKKKERKNPEED